MVVVLPAPLDREDDDERLNTSIATQLCKLVTKQCGDFAVHQIKAEIIQSCKWLLAKAGYAAFVSLNEKNDDGASEH